MDEPKPPTPLTKALRITRITAPGPHPRPGTGTIGHSNHQPPAPVDHTQLDLRAGVLHSVGDQLTAHHQHIIGRPARLPGTGRPTDPPLTEHLPDRAADLGNRCRFRRYGQTEPARWTQHRHRPDAEGVARLRQVGGHGHTLMRTFRHPYWRTYLRTSMHMFRRTFGHTSNSRCRGRRFRNAPPPGDTEPLLLKPTPMRPDRTGQTGAALVPPQPVIFARPLPGEVSADPSAATFPFMRANDRLAAYLTAQGLTQTEFAEAINQEITALTGRHGTVTDRVVRRWLTGYTTWPQERQRRALHAVSGLTAAELGFTAPARDSRPPPQRQPEEDSDVLRRAFLTATVTAALPRRAAVGMSDVGRLRERIDGLAQLDDAQGGSRSLENAGLEYADQARDLLQRSVASARVRGALYALAADATTTAAWAAIDTHGKDRAAAHLHQALTLAGMSADPATGLRAWHNLSMLATQQDRHTDALAAAEAARATPAAHRDPLYASLAHARTASCHARVANRQAALRSLGYAEQALDRADSTLPRPGWIRFYDAAELHGLAAVFHQRLGRPDLAEYRAHHALAQLRPELVRNRIYYTVQLALAQIQQRDVHQAVATVDRALALAGPTLASARIRALLADFRTRMTAAAPYDPVARDWFERTGARPQ